MQGYNTILCGVHKLSVVNSCWSGERCFVGGEVSLLGEKLFCSWGSLFAAEVLFFPMRKKSSWCRFFQTPFLATVSKVMKN